MNNRFTCTILAVVLGLGGSMSADAQSRGKGFGAKSRARVRLMQEAAKRIEDAKVRGAAEEAIRRAEEAVQTGETENLKAMARDAASKAELTPEQMEQAAMAKAALGNAIENASDEASAILNAPSENAKTIELTQAVAAEVAQAATAEVAAEKPRATIEVTAASTERAPGAAPEGALPGDEFPKPVLDKEPQSLVPPVKAAPERKDPTRIDANGGALFDASEKLMVFKDDVKVDHDMFDLSCDTLEVFLYKDVKIGEKDSEGEVEDPITPSPAANRRSDIMKAIATGYVQIIKRSSSGADQVGKCRQAVYEDVTGDLIMRGMPQVQRGADIVIATDEKTTIIFKQDGDMEVHGPHRTEIVKSAAMPSGN